MVYGKVTGSLQPPCECDRSRGYYGSNPNNCDLLDEPCEEGLELSVRGNDFTISSLFIATIFSILQVFL